MKKIFIAFLCFVLLCGCSQKPQEYLISALGVDYDKGLYTVSFEAVIINTEIDEQKREIVSGVGRTLIDAVAEIEKQTTQKIILSHCGIIAVGSGITRTKLKGVMRFCKEHPDITLSVFFVKTENAAKLLGVKPLSSISVGYDLMSMIKTAKNDKKLTHKNRLFEICENESPILPIISPTEKGYYFDKY